MKMKNIMLKEMRLAIIGLFLLGSVPLMKAGENPSAKPVRQKSWFESLFGGSSVQAVRSTVQFTPTKSVSMPSSASGSAPVIAMPSLPSSNLFRRTAVPTVVVAPRGATTSQTSGATSPFGTLSTDRLKRTGSAVGGGFSGGAAAGGLMSSGSQYSSAAANGGGGCMTSSGPTISDGPRKVDEDPDIPFPDPIGDALWPLMLLACAYFIMRIARKRSRALKI